MQPTSLDDDGVLQFTRNGVVHKADLIVVKLLCEQCEDEVGGLKAVNGTVPPTPEFLKLLTTRFPEVFPGIPEWTETMAWNVWHKVSQAMLALKKSTNGTPTLPSGTESTPANSAESKGSDY